MTRESPRTSSTCKHRTHTPLYLVQALLEPVAHLVVYEVNSTFKSGRSLYVTLSSNSHEYVVGIIGRNDESKEQVEMQVLVFPDMSTRHVETGPKLQPDTPNVQPHDAVFFPDPIVSVSVLNIVVPCRALATEEYFLHSLSAWQAGLPPT